MKLKKFIKQFKGSSFPVLVIDDSDNQYIMKMKGAGNGTISLLSEFVVNRVCTILGYPVPNAYWMYIEKNFPWEFGTDEFDDILQKSSGWNLALDYIGDSEQINTMKNHIFENEIIDDVYSIDNFFVNMDRSRLSGNFLKDKNGKIYIIDHGSMFLFHSKNYQYSKVVDNHIFCEYYELFDYKIDERLLDIDIYKDLVAEIPVEILDELSMNENDLLRLIANRINFIKNM